MEELEELLESEVESEEDEEEEELESLVELSPEGVVFSLGVESGVVGFGVEGVGVVGSVGVVEEGAGEVVVVPSPLWHEANPMTGRRSNRAANFLVFFIYASISDSNRIITKQVIF